MRSPWIARDLYDELQARFDTLLDRHQKLVQQMLAMKRKGFEQRADAKPGRVISGGPTAEEAASKRMHDQMVNELADQIASMPGVDPKFARAEAERLRGVALGGSVGEPVL